MSATYVLNPFALVSETEDSFIICTTASLQVRFPKRNKPFIERLTSGSGLSQELLESYISHRRIAELVSKKLLLAGEAPSLQGRYSRQIGYFSLTASDHTQQHSRVAAANVLVLGAGAIGGHVSWNLAAMGVGHITIVDFDTVEETNLNRQLFYTPGDIGALKVEVLCSKLREFNPDITVTAVNRKISSVADIEALADDRTVIIKAIDTPEESTGWTNDVCVTRRIPFITGGFLDHVGVVGPIYLPGRSTCFACLQPGKVRRLHGTGPTFAPLTTIVSSMMAMSAYKVIVGDTASLTNKILSFDTVGGTWQASDVSSRALCQVCGHPPLTTGSAVARDFRGRLWAYWATLVLLMCTAAGIRALTHDRFIGALVLLTFFASMPALDLLLGGNAQQFRRQSFVTTCLYCLLNLCFVGIQALRRANFHISLHFTLDRFFILAQQACTVVLELVVAVTLVYFLVISLMALLKLASRRNLQWLQQ